jgi:hypothetical protein
MHARFCVIPLTAIATIAFATQASAEAMVQRAEDHFQRRRACHGRCVYGVG